MFNYHRFYQKSPPSSLFEKLGLHCLVTFFSTRVIRGGPRILLHLALSLVVVVLIFKLAPDTLFSSLYPTTSFFNWNPDQVVQAVGAKGAAAGGLRIVVFGEDDLASPSRSRNYRATRRPSWTELLCHVLRCTSYLSFTQDFDISSYPVVSQELHNAAIKILLDESAKETAGGDSPGKDYSFYPDMFPIDRNRPDLARQVQSFLAMNKPKITPSDTLWVFTLGTWDVWSLASMPTSISRPLVSLLTTHIFNQVELLYRSSTDKDSVAFSDQRANNTSPKGNFRILIPTLFDPSITPGWVRSRPKLPEVHSKAEQLRNAAYLTDEWNDQILTKLEEWVSKPDPVSSDTEDGGAKMVPFPQRDGFAYDLGGSLLDAIMDEQLRVSDLKTKMQIAMGKSMDYTTGTGEMMDVMKPCVDDTFGSFYLDEEDEKSNDRSKTDIRHVEEASDHARQAERGQYKRNRPGGFPATAAVECRAPDEHLFYTGFELGTRTIAAIAHQVGGMIARNESVRAVWAAEDADGAA
ncbi:hypothetical protein QBC37DRAFT_284310 [Rhypophila decipiens]|uniref:Uncharacterized protein n=1 Tax=Rhypophila decipiens TaxID=261697 RepID=A0AAN6YA73_9PEZI|nr:hypothetical protein QBC37DRAFT_284310 [Rhypophila decipiens]